MSVDLRDPEHLPWLLAWAKQRSLDSLQAQAEKLASYEEDPRRVTIPIALCALGASNARCGRDHFPDCQVSDCRP